MDKFSKEVTLDPKEIPNMNMSQKQDCMAEIDKIRKTAWVYSWIFCLGVIAFIFIYSLIQMVYTLKYRGLLENINPFLILIPVAVFIPSIFAHMMNGKCIIWAYLTYLATGLFTIFTGSLLNAWVALFAFAGAVLYVRLSRVCDCYAALEKEEGFPEFCEITSDTAAAKAIIERSNKKEEPLNILTETAILAAKLSAEKKSDE